MKDEAILLEVAITVLADGRVVFCDLPPDLAQVRDVLAGESPAVPTAQNVRASETLTAREAATASGDAPA